MVPEPQQMAIHQAGHAVVQTLVGREQFAVSRVTLGEEGEQSWQGRPAWGESALDRETLLTIYEFGLVTLAGVAAEERYLSDQPQEEEPLVALSDLSQWQEQAWEVFGDEARIRLVSLNVMRKLQEWFAEQDIWQVVETLAQKLLEHGTLDEEALGPILGLLPPGTPRHPEKE